MMKNIDTWDMDKVRDICCRAGMEKEWIAADGETLVTAGRDVT